MVFQKAVACWAWWLMPVILAVLRWRPEDLELKVSLCHWKKTLSPNKNGGGEGWEWASAVAIRPYLLPTLSLADDSEVAGRALERWCSCPGWPKFLLGRALYFSKSFFSVTQ